MIRILVFLFLVLFMSFCSEEPKPIAKPEVKITYPADGGHYPYTDTYMVIKGEVSGENVVKVIVKVDGETYELLPTEQWALTLSRYLLPGVHVIQALAERGEGVYSDQVNVKFYVDRVVLNSPSEGEIVPLGSDVKVSGTYYGDMSSLEGIGVTVSGSGSTELSLAPSVYENGYFEVVIPGSSLSVGRYVVDVSAGIDVSSSFVVATPPSVGITSIPDNHHVGYTSNLHLYGTALGDYLSTMIVTIDGNNSYSMPVDGTAWDIVVTDITPGVHNINVQLNTSYGPTSVTSSTISLDQVVILTPTNNQVVAPSSTIEVSGQFWGEGTASVMIYFEGTLAGTATVDYDTNTWQYTSLNVGDVGSKSIKAIMDLNIGSTSLTYTSSAVNIIVSN